jgi:hypothetical protein
MDHQEVARQLRRMIDPKEPFSSQLIKPRTDDKKRVPDWALDDKKVEQVLLTVFPKCGTNSRKLEEQGATGRHRAGAARWMRIIHLYWRMNLTSGQVAEEMTLTRKAVERLVERIRVVGNGLFTAPGRLKLSTRGSPRQSWGGRRPGAGRIRTSLNVTK